MPAPLPSLSARLAAGLRLQRPVNDDASKLYATLALETEPGRFECQAPGAAWSGAALEIEGIESSTQGCDLLAAIAAYLPAYLEVVVALHREPGNHLRRSYLFVRSLHDRGQAVAHTVSMVLSALRLPARPLLRAELEGVHARWLPPAAPLDSLLHIELAPLPGVQPAAVPPFPAVLADVESWSYAVLQVLPLAHALDDLQYRHLRSLGGLLRKADPVMEDRTCSLQADASAGKPMAYARWGALLRNPGLSAKGVRDATWEPAQQAGFRPIGHAPAQRSDLLQALPWLLAPATTLKNAQHTQHLDSLQRLAPLMPFKRRRLLPCRKQPAGASD